MNGGRKLSKWNLFVKKVYAEGKSKNKDYEFKNALKDASERKSEMNSMKLSSSSSKKTKGKRKSRSAMVAGKSRKHRRH
jgi:hypothetical protein